MHSKIVANGDTMQLYNTHVYFDTIFLSSYLILKQHEKIFEICFAMFCGFSKKKFFVPTLE